MTFGELKSQQRWVLWRLETIKGSNGKPDKQTKVPYQLNGSKARNNDPSTWKTHAELEPHAYKYSGIGVVLGEVDGVCVWGVDFDQCADAVSGKFSPETREVVIQLNTYAEFSPSGTGCHILGIGKLPGDRPAVKPFPGCKQIEVKSTGYYFTYTARHISKTPPDLQDRQTEITALWERVNAISKTDAPAGLTLTVTASEEERFRKLWAGDMSDYADDHSRADLALVGLLAKRLNNNAFAIDAEFQKSGLYRPKWDRLDYKWGTIYKVIKGEPLFLEVAPEEEPLKEDTETEYLVEAMDGPMSEGWFPKGELSLIGGASGAGKTSWTMPLMEKLRKAEDIYGHGCKARDYRVLLHDRSKKAMHRTMKALHLSSEAIARVVRLTAEHQRMRPDELLDAAIERTPGVEAWVIEGLDLWIPDINKMEIVGPIIDSIQRVAERRNVAVIGTVGSPKQKGKDRYYGRDSLFGSAALARKVETVVLMDLHNPEDSNSVRRCDVLVRNGRAERLFFTWDDTGLVPTEEPDDVPEESANGLMQLNVSKVFKAGEPILYRPDLGPKTNFYRWRRWAIDNKKVVATAGQIYLAPTEVKK